MWLAKVTGIVTDQAEEKLVINMIVEHRDDQGNLLEEFAVDTWTYPITSPPSTTALTARLKGAADKQAAIYNLAQTIQGLVNLTASTPDVASIYVSGAFGAGLIPANTWEAFRDWVVATPIEELLSI